MNRFKDNRKRVILLVEDNEGDALLAQEAFKSSDFNNQLFHVENGVEAMRFLTKTEPYQKMPRPDLILLDLNMPLMDGHQVMQALSGNGELVTIPIIVLTTSNNSSDIINSYALHANCYITKPVDFDQFTQVIKSIEMFWFATVSLPSQS